MSHYTLIKLIAIKSMPELILLTSEEVVFSDEKFILFTTFSFFRLVNIY